MVILTVSLLLLLVLIAYLDPKVPWPRPTERAARYVSIAERSRTLRRD
jgi:hypothetical protein